MKRRGFVTMCVVAAAVALAPAALAADKTVKMSTTTSTESSGLLDVLLPELQKDTGIQVKVFAKGTGAAIRDGIDGNVDVIFVHAKEREDAFVAEGYGTKRYAVMHNDFVLLGPSSDPAGIRGLKHAAAALKQIAGAGAPFVSRGDDSGTHTKEQDLWKASGAPIEEKATEMVKDGKRIAIRSLHPAGSSGWYLSIGQGMGKTLTYAEEKQTYTLSDRGTYIKYKFGRQGGLALEILCEGDPLLFNPYGVIPVNPEKFPHVKYELARQFAEWLVSARGQKLIADYRYEGKQLFFPDAMPDVK